MIQRIYRQLAGGLVAAAMFLSPAGAATFDLQTATIEDINKAFDAGALTSEKLVQLYLNRIAAYDKKGPKIELISPATVSPLRGRSPAGHVAGGAAFPVSAQER